MRQSEELAEHLCRIEPPIERIYSSPFSRCLQTLKPTTERLFKAGKVKTPIRIDRGIGYVLRSDQDRNDQIVLTQFVSEWFGTAPFEHPTPPDLRLLSPLFEHLDQDHVAVHIPASRGESILELHARVRMALDHIITTLDNDTDQPKTVLMCAHAATIIAMGRVLTGQMPDDPDEDDFQCYTAGLSKFNRRSYETKKGVAGNWDCELNSDTSFLVDGAERGW